MRAIRFTRDRTALFELRTFHRPPMKPRYRMSPGDKLLVIIVCAIWIAMLVTFARRIL